MHIKNKTITGLQSKHQMGVVGQHLRALKSLCQSKLTFALRCPLMLMGQLTRLEQSAFCSLVSFVH